MASLTPATKRKRQQLEDFVQQNLAPYDNVQAVIAVGSIATGTARPDSDIDAVLFLEPYDDYIVPAESIWLPSDGSYHSIFVDDPELHANGLQLDFARYDLTQWRVPDYAWPEAVCAGLHAGWIAFDRTGAVTDLIAARTAYPDALRLNRLDNAIVEMDLCLNWDDPQSLWARVEPATAFDRLHATYEALVAALFAYNRTWRPFRSREMTHLLALPWLPDDLDARILPALNAPSLDEAGYANRFAALKSLFDDLLLRLTSTGDYPDDAVSHAFIRSHDEPGRAWNMAEWNRRHAARKA